MMGEHLLTDMKLLEAENSELPCVAETLEATGVTERLRITPMTLPNSFLNVDPVKQ